MFAGTCTFERDARPHHFAEPLARTLNAAPDSHTLTTSVQPGLVAWYRSDSPTYVASSYTAPDGSWWCCDGRIDNVLDLSCQLALDWHLRQNLCELVWLGYKRFGLSIFDRLIGDWSIISWRPDGRELWLISDLFGVQPLYYTREGEHVRWSSDLQLLQMSRGGCTLDRDYLIGAVTRGGPPERTPHREIRSSPPGVQLVLTARGSERRTRCSLFQVNTLRMKRTRDYDEELRRLFLGSVQDRLGKDTHVWSELSGGLDSSSVVCASRWLMSQGRVPTTTLDLVTFVSGSSPEWSEAPFVDAVEKHCQLSTVRFDTDTVPMTPVLEAPTPEQMQRARVVAQWMRANGATTLLTGRYGDLVMASDPYNVASIAQSIRQGNLWQALADTRTLALAAKLTVAAFAMQVIRLLRRRESKNLSRIDIPERTNLPRYAEHLCLTLDATRSLEGWKAETNRLATISGPAEYFGMLSVLYAVTAQRRLQAVPGLGIHVAHPFLARPLVEFVLSIPLRTLCAPGETRTLMRRAFRTLVPDRVLQRAFKGYPAPMMVRRLKQLAGEFLADPRDWILAELNIVEPLAIQRRLETVFRGGCQQQRNLSFLVGVEVWLRHLAGVERQNSVPSPEQTAAIGP